jgi:hypothetical protein
MILADLSLVRGEFRLVHAWPELNEPIENRVSGIVQSLNLN